MCAAGLVLGAPDQPPGGGGHRRAFSSSPVSAPSPTPPTHTHTGRPLSSSTSHPQRKECRPPARPCQRTGTGNAMLPLGSHRNLWPRRPFAQTSLRGWVRQGRLPFPNKLRFESHVGVSADSMGKPLSRAPSVPQSPGGSQHLIGLSGVKGGRASAHATQSTPSTTALHC